MDGTYELPKAKRDRFQCKLTPDLPSDEDELRLIDRFDESPDLGPTDLSQVVTVKDVLSARKQVRTGHVADSVKSYIQSLVSATRTHDDLAHGGSPRATLALLHTSKARAAIHGREYVIPDDVKALAVPVMRHQLVLSTEAKLSDRSTVKIIDTLLKSVTPPSGDSTVDDETTNDGTTSNGASGGMAASNGEDETDNVSDSPKIGRPNLSNDD